MPKAGLEDVGVELEDTDSEPAVRCELDTFELILRMKYERRGGAIIIH